MASHVAQNPVYGARQGCQSAIGTPAQSPDAARSTWLYPAARPAGSYACGERRGVLLLISLVLLSLFLLLGTSYIIIVQRAKVCGVPGMLGSITRTIARETSEKVANDILKGQPPSPGSGIGPTSDDRITSYYQNSLLRDKYGSMIDDDGVIWDQFKLDSITRLGSAYPFFWVDLSRLQANATFGYYTDTVPASRSPEAQAANRPQDAYAGRILAINAPEHPNAAFRVIATTQLVNGTERMLVHQLNHRVVFDHTALDVANDDYDVFIQGREFSGRLSDENESYDAPDDRNLFLAWEQTEAVLGRDQVPNSGDEPEPTDGHKYIIPSFHRPDKVLVALKADPAGFASAMASAPHLLQLRPAGKMDFHPDANWQAQGFATGAPVAPAAALLEHPNFTGSNVRTMPNGQKYYFDPINGPWDVDNDGDGITDSIWLDIGMQEVELDNQLCKPLVAIKVIDLDARLNLNAHGSPYDTNHRLTPFAQSPPASGSYFAGTDPSSAIPAARVASLPTGLGHGVADINLRHLLPGGYGTVGSSIFRGAASSGTQYTPSGLRIDTGDAEGRYGDTVNGSGTLSPAAGQRGLDDVSIETPDIERALAAAESVAIANRYGSNLAPASPVSPRGLTRVGLDQLGQPIYARPIEVTGVTPWTLGDKTDDPYDLSLGRSAPRPGWDYDAESQPSSLQDNLFSAAQLERLLRLFDSSSDSLSGRLTSLLGSDAEVARLATTTESWDSTAICVPQEILQPLLALNDQLDSALPSLVSWDVQMGLRMDVNRPFGNRQDDDSNGVVDEPAEHLFDINAISTNITPFGNVALTNGRDVDGDGDPLNDQGRARELFARHLYVLVRYLCPDVPVEEAAQWAVNVVDFRDHDTAMTRFQYDETFSAGSTVWNTNAASPVVWGCERPELLLTEAISWRSLKESLDTPNGATVENPYFRWDDTGMGGLMFELYHPWTGQTDQGLLAQRIPGEFATNPANTFNPTDTVDLTKTSPSGIPVFQLAVVADTPANLDSLETDPAWPRHNSSESPNFERVIYLGPEPASVTLAGDKGGEAFAHDPAQAPATDPNIDPTDPNTVSPGQFAIIGGPVRPDPGGQPNRYLLPVELAANPADDKGVVVAYQNVNESVIDPTDGSVAPVDLGFNDVAPLPPFVISSPLQEKIRGTYPDGNDTPRDFFSRATGLRLPKDLFSGPVGAVLHVSNTQSVGPPLPLRLPVANTSVDPSAALTAASQGQYRVLLRRLADPLQDYDETFNPYITIDSMVFHDQAVISNASNPLATTHVLTSTERGSGVVDASGDFDPKANNIWKQDDSDVTPAIHNAGPNATPPGTYSAFAFDPDTGMRSLSPKSFLFCGTVSTATTVEWSMGFLPWRLEIPPPGSDDTPPFPWLTWLNRDYLSPAELLLVPRSSPSMLLRQHAHKPPFSHLFFHYGDDNSPILPKERLGLLEFLRTPSPFADAEHWIASADGTSLSTDLRNENGKPLFIYPHNRLNFFREPGRVNLNTMASPLVWDAITGGRSPAPYEDEISYDAAASFAPETYQPSEDWLNGASALATANWNLETSEDINQDGELSLNHDSNNDGKQTVSDTPLALRSLAAARRGWPASSNPNAATETIAGNFARELSRSRHDSSVRWFSKAFRSGWQSANGDYATDESLLMREVAPYPITNNPNPLLNTVVFGFSHVDQVNPTKPTQNLAHNYLDSSSDMIKWEETNPTTNKTMTYWGPTQDDTVGELIYRFPLPQPLQSAQLLCSLPCWTGDPRYSGEAAASLEVSSDGSTWLELDNHIPASAPLVGQSIDASTKYTGTLPFELSGATEIWVRIRLKTEGSIYQFGTPAQFGLSSPDNSVNVFELQVELERPQTPLLFEARAVLQDSSNNNVAARAYADPDRNPYFHYRDVMRLANTTTQRSNVFAIWMTVGFFNIEEHPTVPGQKALAAEHGLDTGTVKRHKAFMILDRSIPVGFSPFHAFNSSETRLIKRDTE